MTRPLYLEQRRYIDDSIAIFLIQWWKYRPTSSRREHDVACLASKRLGLPYKLQCFLLHPYDPFSFFYFRGAWIDHLELHVPELACHNCNWLGLPKYNFSFSCLIPRINQSINFVPSRMSTLRSGAMPNQTLVYKSPRGDGKVSIGIAEDVFS